MPWRDSGQPVFQPSRRQCCRQVSARVRVASARRFSHSD
ncbi:MAG: hypothetical protein H7Z40_10110 [Phycisphaerae bacterium]|nr:hypothetical protein [Gemmatimonadaceae bacterium]